MGILIHQLIEITDMATYTNSKWQQNCHTCQGSVEAGAGVFLTKADRGWLAECATCYQKRDGYLQYAHPARTLNWSNPWADRWAQMAALADRYDRVAMRQEALECELDPTIDCPWCHEASYSRPSMRLQHFCSQGHHAEGRSAEVVGRDVETATNHVQETVAKYG